MFLQMSYSAPYFQFSPRSLLSVSFQYLQFLLTYYKIHYNVDCGLANTTFDMFLNILILSYTEKHLYCCGFKQT